MRVLVTGANGMLSTHVIKELVKREYRVKAMLRKSSKYQLDPHPAVELVEGDILDRMAVNQAIKDCDLLVHAAGITAPDIPDYTPYQEVNVKGTGIILEAAVTNKIQKIIYVSSANTIGHGNREKPGKETDKAKPPFIDSYYAKSKMAAQNLALSYSDRLEVIVVNPSFMIGAFDAKLGSNRIIVMGYDKKFVFYPPGGKNFVNTRDVARGIALAFEKGRNGECYLLTGENLSYREFFEKLKAKNNHNTTLIRIPPRLLKSLGYLAEIPRKLKVKTPLSVQNMQILCTANFYNSDKATKELGLNFYPIDEGIEEAVQWFKKENIL